MIALQHTFKTQRAKLHTEAIASLLLPRRLDRFERFKTDSRFGKSKQYLKNIPLMLVNVCHHGKQKKKIIEMISIP